MAQAGLFSGKAIVNSGGLPQMMRFWQAAFQPVLSRQFLAITFESALVTVAYAISGTFASLLIGCLFGLLASEIWWQSLWPRHRHWQRLAWTIVRGLLAIPRGIHELLWGLFFLNIFGLDPLVAILAIGIPFGATVAKVFAETLDEVDKRPFFALLNSGATPLKAIFYGLIPVALPDLLSYAFYRLECAIRSAAVLGVVGAGGLGYQILLSMQTLNYNETWTLFYALMLLSGGADWWSAQVRQRLGRTDVACGWLEPGQNGRFLPPLANDTVLLRSVTAVSILVPLSFIYLQPNFGLLWAERTQRLLDDITSKAWPLELTVPDIQNLFQLSQATLAMSIVAFVLASVGGVVLSFLAARTFFEPGGVFHVQGNGRMHHLVHSITLNGTRALLLLMRAIPAPIWALMFLFVFFPGMLPGALALAIYNLGVLGRLMAEVAENLDKRPLTAINTLGANRGATFLYGLVPAVSPRYLAYSLYRWENLIRETVIVGLVGAGGLGRELTQQLAAFNYRAVLALLICTILLIFGVDLVSNAVRRTIK